MYIGKYAEWSVRKVHDNKFRLVTSIQIYENLQPKQKLDVYFMI